MRLLAPVSTRGNRSDEEADVLWFVTYRYPEKLALNLKRMRSFLSRTNDGSIDFHEPSSKRSRVTSMRCAPFWATRDSSAKPNAASNTTLSNRMYMYMTRLIGASGLDRRLYGPRLCGRE